ncbi:MAG: toxin-antitoxin system YwqK family antitoxin [Parachlamydiaceae bacterium]
MKSILIALLLLAGCAQTRTSQEAPKLSSIHIIDREGMTEAISNPERLKLYETVNFCNPQPYQKVLRVYSRDASGNMFSYITTYHSNGQLRQYLEVVNNRACGDYREWHSNGQLKVSASVVEGIGDISLAAEKSWVFDGDSSAYDECGRLLAVIRYCRGSLEGVSTYYHKNGSVWKEIPYANNALCGDFRIYYDSGCLLQSTYYVNGNKEGVSMRYWPGDQIAVTETYKNNLLLEGSYYSLGGQPVCSIANGEGTKALFGKADVSELHEVRHGVEEGSVQIFDEEGNTHAVFQVKNGLKQGEEVRFYSKKLNKEPQRKLSINWYQGKIQGVVKTWYESGTMESQKEMSDNKRNGVSTAWYKDGQLMMIEEYDQGKIKKGDYFRKGDRRPISQIVNSEGTATLYDSDGNFVRKIEYVHGKPI